MKLSKLGMLVVLPFALVACGAEEEPMEEEAVVVTPGEPATTPAVEPAAPAAPMGMETTVNMQPVGGSGVSGQATLTPQGQQTQVMVMLNAAAGGTTHQGHIHAGTCESPGDVVQPLQPITLDAAGSGSMTTTVSVDPNTVMNGQHIVLYHEAGGDPGMPVVCGAIPQHTM